MLLAIDPGSGKIGIAILALTGELQHKAIVATADLQTACQDFIDRYKITQIVIGDGTGHKQLKKLFTERLSADAKNIPIAIVNEKFTTEMGKIRYWEVHKPKGWRALIPTSFQVPPVPVDDFVAWIIGDIYLGRVEPEDVKRRK